jgi:hypothetical protein
VRLPVSLSPLAGQGRGRQDREGQAKPDTAATPLVIVTPARFGQYGDRVDLLRHHGHLAMMLSVRQVVSPG